MTKITRLKNTADDLQKVLKNLKSQQSRRAVKNAIDEIENSLGYSDGVWVVRQNGTHLSKFADLSDLDTANILRLAAGELMADKMARALNQSIEKSQKTLPGGVKFWSYSAGEIVREMLRIVAADAPADSETGEF